MSWSISLNASLEDQYEKFLLKKDITIIIEYPDFLMSDKSVEQLPVEELKKGFESYKLLLKVRRSRISRDIKESVQILQLASNSLGDDKFYNAKIAYAVKVMVGRLYLHKDNHYKQIHKEIDKFLVRLKEKGFLASNHERLEDIDEWIKLSTKSARETVELFIK